jgi:hypothetical protein
MHLTIGEMRTGDRHYFTGFIRDLTDQQLTEARLRELQAEVTHMSRFTALGEMASTLAHEINQPLTAINNYLRGCHRLAQRLEGEPMPALRDALAKAGDQALRAGQIIRRLREFVARGDSERQIENLPKLIEDASTLALVGARENAITWSSGSIRAPSRSGRPHPDPAGPGEPDPQRLRGPDGLDGRRELSIETRLLGDTVQVSVARFGAGLAPEVGRISSSPSSPPSRRAWAGPLDLPHHHRGPWRQDLGGRPAARRDDLPLHLARAGDESEEASLAGSDIVHVIDDDADVRQSLAFLLSTVGLACASTNRQRLPEVLPEVQEGCIVTDVRMPGIDGIELQRRLRTPASSCR